MIYFMKTTRYISDFKYISGCIFGVSPVFSNNKKWKDSSAEGHKKVHGRTYRKDTQKGHTERTHRKDTQKGLRKTQRKDT